jgi:hypothetical protein
MITAAKIPAISSIFLDKGVTVGRRKEAEDPKILRLRAPPTSRRSAGRERVADTVAHAVRQSDVYRRYL